MIGNMKMYEKQSFQREVLNTLFSDEVPRYLILCLKIDAFSSKVTNVLKHAVKLVGMYLKYCLEEIELGEFNEKRAVFENLIKFYLKSDF